MSYFKYNLIFLLSLYLIQSALNAKIDLTLKNLDPKCSEYNTGTKPIILEEEIKNSKKIASTIFLFFSNKKDNYEKLKTMAGLSNKLLKDILKIEFFCKNELSSKKVTIDSPENDRDDKMEFYGIKNGKIVKQSKMITPNEHYLEYMFNDFNLTKHLETKYPESDYGIKATKSQNEQIISFIQMAKSLKNPSKGTTINLFDNKKVGTKIPMVKDTKKLEHEIKKENKKAMKSESEEKSFLRTAKSLKNPSKGTTIDLFDDEKVGTKIPMVKDTKIGTTIPMIKDSKIGTKIPLVKDTKKLEQKIILENLDNFKKSESKNSKKSNLFKTIEETEQKIHHKITTNNSMKNTKKENIRSKINKNKQNNDKNPTSFIETQVIVTTVPSINSKISVLDDEYKLNFAQTKIEFNPVDYLTSEYLELSTQATNRLSRFLLAFFIVLISSLLSFLLVKYSIDWATKSRSELNSIKDKENREILEEINKNHNLIRFN